MCLTCICADLTKPCGQNTQEIKHPNLHTISFVAVSKEHVCTLISQKPQTSQDFVEMFARSGQQDACEKNLHRKWTLIINRGNSNESLRLIIISLQFYFTLNSNIALLLATK